MPETITTTSTSRPFDEQLQFLLPGFQATLDNVLNRPQQFFPNSTVVPFSNQTQQALGLQEQRALQGSPVNNAAQQTLLNTMGGQFTNPGLSAFGPSNQYTDQFGMPTFSAPQSPQQFKGASGAPAQLPQPPQGPQPGYQPSGPAQPQNAFGGLNGMNPYLNNVAQQVTNAVAPRVNSAFAGAGRLGSNAQYDTMSRAVADAVAPFAFQNFENERGRQLQAAGMAPQLANQDYFDIGQLRQAGQQREAQGGLELQERLDRFNFLQGEPVQRTRDYMGLISGNLGQQETRQQPVFQNRGLSALGGAGLGAGIGNLIGGQNGFGGLSSGALTGLGALAGGLFGLF